MNGFIRSPESVELLSYHCKPWYKKLFFIFIDQSNHREDEEVQNDLGQGRA